MRWLLLDEILRITKGLEAKSKSRVPQAPYSAEILMIEMMAQTAGLLLGAEDDFRSDLVLAKIEQADFFYPYRSGEAIEITARSESLRPEGAWFEAEIRRASTKISGAKLMLVSAGRLVPGTVKSTTFHDAFMNHFRVREKVSEQLTALPEQA